MSEIHGPLSAVAGALVEHDRLTPPQQNIAHAGTAAELLTCCYWLAPFFEHRSGTPFIAWAAVSGAGMLWLLAALLTSRGQPRDFSIMVRALVFGGIFGALLWVEAYPDWGPLGVYLVQGFYWSLVAIHTARFIVAAQLLSFGGGNALRIIDRQRKRRNAPLKPVRR
jgi:hypothetical protein